MESRKMGKCTKLSTLLLCATLVCGCNTDIGIASASSKKNVGAPGTLVNSIGMTMVKLPIGYYVSKYETRQSEFEAVMGYNPSWFQGEDHPVETITAAEADEFCRRLTQLEREKGTLPEGYVYDLPTYGQWKQYVADASLNKAIVPKKIGNRKWADFDSHRPVGSGDVNRFGLYDLRGNVCEYSKDMFRPETYRSRLILGASWTEYRTGHQHKYNQGGFTDISHKSYEVGFRCVLVPMSAP